MPAADWKLQDEGRMEERYRLCALTDADLDWLRLNGWTGLANYYESMSYLRMKQKLAEAEAEGE